MSVTIGNDSYRDLIPHLAEHDLGKCSVEGCRNLATAQCDLCEKVVCQRHIKSTVALSLCFSCHIGMIEGMPDETKGLY